MRAPEADAPRLRLLLLAPWCDAMDVGEAWSAFQWVSRLARRHEVTALTIRKRSAPCAAQQLSGRCRVVEWTEPPGLGRLSRFNSMAKPAYALFYARARAWIRRALAQGERFDLAHQLSPLALRYPSPAVGLVEPLVVGPLGGSLQTPPGFQREMASSRWYTRLRAIDRLRLRRDPLLRRTLAKADLLLGVGGYVRELLESQGVPLRRFDVESETGVERLPEPPAAPFSRDSVRLLFVGRLVRNKGARDAIRAMAHLQDVQGLRLDIVGEGEDRRRCEEEIAQLGLEGRVQLHGRVPRRRVDEFYRRADVFFFPSFREPSGNVVFEAMGFGLPLVVADAGGPAAAADESCSVRVEPVEPERYARDLAQAVRRLLEDPDRARAMGRAARARAAELALWDRKIERMEQRYLALLQQGRHTAQEAARC